MGRDTNLGYIFTCPIRGEVSTIQEEEGVRIECLKYLLEAKKIPKENIAIEPVLRHFGSGGRNNLRPDIVVFDRPKSEAMSEGKVSDAARDAIVLVAEIKVNKDDNKMEKIKTDAICNQLRPALDFCPKAIGIYWDLSERVCVESDGTEFPVSNLPNWGEKLTGFTSSTLGDLMPMRHGQKVWTNLKQVLRNHGSQANHRDIFKLIISKYYDEIAAEAGESKQVDFCIRPQDLAFRERINKLLRAAKKHYQLMGGFNELVDGDLALNDDALRGCVRVLAPYTLLSTDGAVLQDLFMKFAPELSKKSLQQYFTPVQLVNFMTQHVRVTRMTKAIDPCCGCGDFMVGVLRNAQKRKLDIGRLLYCWDVDAAAATMAQINMVLHGDGHSNVEVLNSLDEHNKDSERYDLVITNPPFGDQTIYDGKAKNQYKFADKQTGKLFVERSLALLKDEGILIIVLPSGYMGNSSDAKFRVDFLKASKLVAVIRLPGGVFSVSGAGVSTSILILQKTAPADKYKAFVATAANVGFECGKKAYHPLLKRKDSTGAIIMGDSGESAVNNDLDDIAEQLKCFAADAGIDKFQPPQKKVKYNTMTIERKNWGEAINPSLYDQRTGYPPSVACIQKKGGFNLEGNVEISDNDTLDIDNRDLYRYIETRNATRDCVRMPPQTRGWALPHRARQMVRHGDIFAAKMGGQPDNFFYGHEHYEGCLASNGYFKIQFEDEVKKLSFLRFLFSPDWAVQSKALATGSIMETVDKYSFFCGVYVPLIDDAKIAEMKEYLKTKARFLALGIE